MKASEADNCVKVLFQGAWQPVPMFEQPSEALSERRLRRTMETIANEPLRLALAGGGTGGHIVPGRNLLAHLRGTQALADVLWFQAGRRVEDEALAGLARELEPTPVERLTLSLEPRGGGAPSRWKLATRLAPEVWRARRALARHRSQVLFGLGGFTVLPPVLAAVSLGIPVALFEINAVPGRATRFLAPLAKRVFHAWHASLPSSSSSSGRHRWTGPPLGTAYLEGDITERERQAACTALELDADRPVLFVVGGSQGAQALNQFVRAELERFALAGVQVVHQVGPGRIEEAAEARPGYLPIEFVSDMRRGLAAATVVLCRGGASTIAELGAVRRPAWVVPYPHHKDQHQERNARELGEGVRIVPQAQLDSALGQELVALCRADGRAERDRMRAELEGRVPIDCAVQLGEALLALRR